MINPVKSVQMHFLVTGENFPAIHLQHNRLIRSGYPGSIGFAQTGE